MFNALQKLRPGRTSSEHDVAEPNEAAIYKSLLLDMQYSQLEVSREYQRLFEEKEKEINRLKTQLGESVAASKPSHSPAKPLRELSQEDLRVVLREWERKMKANILAKTEAIAEAQAQKEISEALRSQLEALRTHVRQQDEALKRQTTVQSVMDQSRNDHAAALDKIMTEYGQVVHEFDGARSQLAQARLEINALRTKADSDKKTLEILVSQQQTGSSSPRSSITTTTMQHRDSEEANNYNAAPFLSPPDTQLQLLLREAETRVDELEHKLVETEQQVAKLVQEKEALDYNRATEKKEEEMNLSTLKESERMLQLHVEKSEGDNQQLHDKIEALIATQEGEKLKANEAFNELQKELENQVNTNKALESRIDQLNNELEASKIQVSQSLEEVSNATAKMMSEKQALEKELEKQMSHSKTLQEQIDESKRQLVHLESNLVNNQQQLQLVNNNLQQTKVISEQTIQASQQELQSCRTSLEQEISKTKLLSSHLEQAKSSVQDYQSKLVTFETTMAELKQSLITEQSTHKVTSESLQATQTRFDSLYSDFLESKRKITELESSLHTLETQAKQREQQAVDAALQAERAKHYQIIVELKSLHEAALKSKQEEVVMYKDMYSKETMARRQAHDELMDLKGNIRVFARVRPVLASEKQLKGNAGRDVAEFPPDCGGRDLIVRREDDSKSRFEFDMVFNEESSQEQVFATVAPLVVSFLDGVNVTLFAYGQTGSGKTYTMEGTKSDPGVNGRALQRVFELGAQRSGSVSYVITASVLEVYNESLYDLLVDNSAVGEALDIRLNPETKAVFAQGLSKRQVNSMTDVQEAMRIAQMNRSVGQTNMNEHSSRSHLVLTLTANGKNLVTGQTTTGNLTMIDLAGSERLAKSEAQGDRLKEAQAINKSLSALGDVIQALGERGKTGGHIPFRNSKLTYLLQDQLSGNSKVGFFVHVSPVEWNVQETLCSLKFAERCRKTELGAVVVGGKGGAQGEVAKLRRLVEDLQSQLGGDSNSTVDPLSSTPTRGGSPVKAPTSAPRSEGKS